MSFTRVAIYAANPSTTRGEFTKLSASKGKIVYTNGKTVFIRDISNPALGVSYSGHRQNTTVARISPTGYYCASADTLGNVRIWDILGEDQVLKGEYKVISGKINDLEWDGESKRIIAVGDGKEKWVVSMVHCAIKMAHWIICWGVALVMHYGWFLDRGDPRPLEGVVPGARMCLLIEGAITSSQVVNAVAIRHQRPFRAATAGDDNLIVFHQGNAIAAYILRTPPPPPSTPHHRDCVLVLVTAVLWPSEADQSARARAQPFPGPQTIKTHTKFVQDVRYAPSGDHFASVGSDGKVFLYDGKTGETLGEFSEGHSGTAYALSWCPDSKAISTCSADATVKLWDIETRKATTTYTLGTGLEHQQVGNVWSAPDTIVSLSFSGCLNVFDRRSGEKQVLHGPQKAVTAAAISTTASETFFVGSADGRVLSYDSTGTASPLAGQGHTNLVSGLASTPDGRVFSTGFDDRVREVEGSGFTSSVFSTASQPKTLASAEDGTIFVVGLDAVEAIRNNQKVADLRPWGVATKPTAIAATGSLVAIGFGDQKVRLYDWDGKTLQEAGLLNANGGLVNVLAFSPDGSKLAAGDRQGHTVRRGEARDDHQPLVLPLRPCQHTLLDRGLAALRFRALDTHIYVWSVRKPTRKIAIMNAIPGGVNGVLWVAEGRLAGTGADAAVRVWQVTFHEP
ncbi:WD40-repeat-containing domain protein [Lactarius quietus]|nr:WD40-repeat-containing domain protein [Lactarius quietus]